MKIKWLFAISFLLSLLGTFYITNPFVSKADVSCQPIYGGGQTCVTSENLHVDKKILNPKTNKMVDNLGVKDQKFEPGTVVSFEINVKNTSDNVLKKVDVTDMFPDYLNFFSGTGSFDVNKKTLTFSIEDLKVNETKNIKVTGKVADADQISIEQGIVCVVNQVMATNSDDSSESSQDNTQFCIEKKVSGETKGGFPVLPITPVYSTPATGSESLVLFSLIPTGIAGWFLRKHSLKKEVKK